ncbi:UbiA family prenyltransferase [Lichenibacterium dinghuense]|uniref:UbiA family prenyltransferase n=1 Tax=Lichenibacterium dinghuense TaxID=2895977 RepID=UPI001F01D28D|nr:UbiA family prenyltransferase [Lichenibacterium sp. 6Y81]
MQAIDTRGRSDDLHGRDIDPASFGAVASPVLVVDLDRALLRADPLHERLFAALKSHPFAIPKVAAAALSGRAALAAAASDVTGDFAVDACPRRPGVEALVSEARAAGRTVTWLSRAGDAFADLTASGDEIRRPEPSADAEARALQKRHPDGFAFLGHSDADLPIWRAARERFGVDLAPGLRRRAEAEGLGIAEISRPRPVAAAVLRGMRPHQWLKNLLVFVPFALSMGELHARDAGLAVVAFGLLCALTSGTYLVNDLFDIDADRRHPRKRKRPIASGDLPVATACLAAAALIGGAIACACLLRLAFAAALGSYLVITLAYSFRLKKMAMVDVLVIAMLFTLRILAGMLLVSEKPSHWLLMFSIFFFLSLAFMKREVEFGVVRQAGRTTLSGRGYDLDDRLYVLCCGLSSGIASVVIFSLFITATIERYQFNYRSPELLWGVMGLLGYWILRMWMLTTRGLMNDDPILFAARDRTSILLGAACAVLAVCAQVIRL